MRVCSTPVVWFLDPATTDADEKFIDHKLLLLDGPELTREEKLRGLCEVYQPNQRGIRLRKSRLPHRKTWTSHNPELRIMYRVYPQCVAKRSNPIHYAKQSINLNSRLVT